MSLNPGRSKLFNTMKTLRGHWERVQDVWDGSVRRDFDETVWKPLDDQVGSTLRATDRLDQVLLTMRRECSMEQDV